MVLVMWPDRQLPLLPIRTPIFDIQFLKILECAAEPTMGPALHLTYPCGAF